MLSAWSMNSRSSNVSRAHKHPKFSLPLNHAIVCSPFPGFNSVDVYGQFRPCWTAKSSIAPKLSIHFDQFGKSSTTSLPKLITSISLGRHKSPHLSISLPFLVDKYFLYSSSHAAFVSASHIALLRVVELDQVRKKILLLYRCSCLVTCSWDAEELWSYQPSF